MQLGDYHIVNEISRGNFGKIYLGRKQGIDYAIKEDMFGSAIINEIAVSSIIDHPNITRILSFCATNDKIYTISPKEDMKIIEYMRNNLSSQERNKLVYQLLSALSFLHENSIHHGSLYLDNILITNRNIRLIDFGLSSIKDAHTYHELKFFIFDAEVSNNPQITEYLYQQRDIWDCGMVIYQILTGEIENDDITSPMQIVQDAEEFFLNPGEYLLKHNVPLEWIPSLLLMFELNVSKRNKSLKEIISISPISHMQLIQGNRLVPYLPNSFNKELVDNIQFSQTLSNSILIPSSMVMGLLQKCITVVTSIDIFYRIMLSIEESNLQNEKIEDIIYSCYYLSILLYESTKVKTAFRTRYKKSFDNNQFEKMKELCLKIVQYLKGGVIVSTICNFTNSGKILLSYASILANPNKYIKISPMEYINTIGILPQGVEDIPINKLSVSNLIQEILKYISK